MGNITNLATTGTFAVEKGNFKVSFNFVIDQNTKSITRIEGGNVVENGEIIADFYSVYYRPYGEPERVAMTLTKGREIELTSAIVEAISGFEHKMTNEI